MYQFSRAMYREISNLIDPSLGSDATREVLEACERTLERMATDRRYFARPARTLFLEIRHLVPVISQKHALMVITHYLGRAETWIEQQPMLGLDHHGRPLQCRATTRRGTACQRTPLPRNGYCPSHQHLAETEDVPAALVAA